MAQAIAYIRVSTKRQGQSGLGLDAQRRAVADYVASSGLDLIGEYQDIESGAHNDRPGLRDALDMCAITGAVLVVAKLDRLSRDAAFLIQLRDSMTDFVACDMPGANKITIGIMALLAQQEREMISTRTKQALQAARERGTKLGGFRENAFGDRRGVGAADGARRAADEYATRLASVLRNLQTQGMSLRAMAAELNSRNIKTRRGGQWHAATVRNLLQRINQN